MKVHTQVGKDGGFEVKADALPETKSLKDIINGIPDAMEGFFSNLFSLVTGNVSGVVATSKDGGFPETSSNFYDFASVVSSDILFLEILNDGFLSIKGKRSFKTYDENNRSELPFYEIKAFSPEQEAVKKLDSIFNKKRIDTTYWSVDMKRNIRDLKLEKGDSLGIIMKGARHIGDFIK